MPIPLLPLPDTQNMHFPKWPPNTISKISHLRSMSQVMNTWQIQLYLAQVTDYKCEKARFCVCIFREMPPNLTFLKQLAYCNVLRNGNPYRNVHRIEIYSIWFQELTFEQDLALLLPVFTKKLTIFMGNLKCWHLCN